MRQVVGCIALLLLPIAVAADSSCPLDFAPLIQGAQSRADEKPLEIAPFHYLVMQNGSMKLAYAPPINNYRLGHPLLELRMEGSARYQALMKDNSNFTQAVEQARECFKHVKLPKELDYASWRGRKGRNTKIRARNTIRHIGNAILGLIGYDQLGMSIADALSDEQLAQIDQTVLEEQRRVLLEQSARKPPPLTDPSHVFLYCPGSDSNIVIRWTSNYGAQLRELLRDPICFSLYEDGRIAFQSDLDTLEFDSMEMWHAQLRTRMEPIIAALRAGSRSCAAQKEDDIDPNSTQVRPRRTSTKQ